MKFSIEAPKIEIRTITSDKKKSLNIRALAMVPNKYDIYKTVKDKSGKIKSFKSIFTDKCIESIKKQAKTKPFFIDAMHQTAFSLNTKRYLEGKGLKSEEIEPVLNYYQIGKLPLFRLNNIDFADEGVIIDFNMNPVYRDLDEQHKSYYDAVEYSLQNGYLKGVSANFGIKSVDGPDDDLRINDVDMYGFSVMDATASSETNILDVAVRTMMQFRTNEEGGRMSDEIEKKLKDAEERLAKAEEALRKKEQEAEAKLKELEDKNKQTEISKQQEEWKKQQEDLHRKLDEQSKIIEAIQKKTENQGKVPMGQDKYGQMQNEDKKVGKNEALAKLREEFKVYEEGQKAIKMGRMPPPDYDPAFAGQLLQIGADINSHMAGLTEEGRRLIGKSAGDVVVPRQNK